MSQTFDTLFANFASFTLIGILAFIPLVVLSAIASGDLAFVTSDIERIGWRSFALSIGAVMITSQVAYTAIVYGSIAYLSGEKISPARMISRSLHAFLPVIAASILVAVMTILGYVVLVIPGVMISIMLYVVVPAIVAEGKSPIAALKRSEYLTAGSRWPLFGAPLLLGIISGITSWLGDFVPSLLHAPDNIYVVGTVTIVVFGVTAALSGVASAIFYMQLKESKEGASVETVAEIFA